MSEILYKFTGNYLKYNPEITTMEKKRKKIELVSISIDKDMYDCNRNRYILETDTPITNATTLELTEIVETPETLKEFREKHNLSKSDLVNWINDNYEG